jgi:hypothetical protein
MELDVCLPLIGWFGRDFTPYRGRQANGFSFPFWRLDLGLRAGANGVSKHSIIMNAKD